jgi:hypothetical protein
MKKSLSKVKAVQSYAEMFAEASGTVAEAFALNAARREILLQ